MSDDKIDIGSYIILGFIIGTLFGIVVGIVL